MQNESGNTNSKRTDLGLNHSNSGKSHFRDLENGSEQTHWSHVYSSEAESVCRRLGQSKWALVWRSNAYHRFWRQFCSLDPAFCLIQPTLLQAPIRDPARMFRQHAQSLYQIRHIIRLQKHNREKHIRRDGWATRASIRKYRGEGESIVQFVRVFDHLGWGPGWKICA
jgi:hypothetical protein